MALLRRAPAKVSIVLLLLGYLAVSSLCVCVHAGEVASRPAVRDLLASLEYGPAPESPAVAEAWLDDHGRSFGHFIGNRWVKPEGRKTYDTYNPATGQRLATTVQGG